MRYGNCITIDIGPWVNNRCGPAYGILTANVTLSCSGTQTPTMEPTFITTEPTRTPSIPTSEPTLEPTNEPTLPSYPTTRPTQPTRSPLRDSRIIRNVFCGERLTGSIRSFETDFYRLLNVPINTLSIQLDSCSSNYDTWLQVFDDRFRLIYQWYVHFI